MQPGSRVSAERLQSAEIGRGWEGVLNPPERTDPHRTGRPNHPARTNLRLLHRTCSRVARSKEVDLRPKWASRQSCCDLLRRARVLSAGVQTCGHPLERL